MPDTTRFGVRSAMVKPGTLPHLARDLPCAFSYSSKGNLGARVLRDHRLEAFAVDVGIDLRGRDVGVAEHRLDGAQIRTALEQVGGETVPQRVRIDALWNA